MSQLPGAPDQPPAPDPVVARRRRIGRWADVGQRVGYLLFGVAVVLFVVATITDLPRAIVSAIIVTMALGSVVLAPSIVVGFGVRAADRDDRERAAAMGQRGRNLSS
jgi:uncharacterized membrane protein